MFRYTKATAVRELIVWIAALLTLMPFYFLVITALKPNEDLLTTGTSAPPPPSEKARRPPGAGTPPAPGTVGPWSATATGGGRCPPS